MYPILFSLILGVFAAYGFIWLVASKSRHADRVFRIGLVVAAIIYLNLAWIYDASSSFLLIEGAGVLVFLIVALASMGRFVKLLAWGWLAHPIWDLALHAPVGSFTHSPRWYVFACVGFDVIVGMYLLKRESNLNEAH